MRLLIVTQTVDRSDPVLGFFHRWLEEFAKHFEHIHVICLKEGTHSLPQNITVHSLGKGAALGRDSAIYRTMRRLKYLVRFLKLIFALRKEYDAIFVHMNQEYVLLGGKLWWVLRKPVYLWRNHYAGSIFTDIASLFCRKIFCTSKFSYTAKYRKTILMPVGIDTNVFKPQNIPRKAGSILSLGRIAPSKRVDVLVEALAELKQKNVEVEAHFFGDALPKDSVYRDTLLKRVGELGLENVRFHSGIPNDETPKVYSAHDVFVNCSGSGMYDKTIFEAAACGCIVLASSRDFSELAPDFSFTEGSSEELAARIERLMSQSGAERESARASMRALAERHSLQELGRRIAEVVR